MIVDLFLILIILISFFILIKILIGKFPILVKINIQEISKERERKLKFKILEKRLLEKLEKIKSISQSIIDLFKKIENKFLLWEKEYLKKYINVARNIPKELDERVKKISSEANKFLENKNFEEAEKKFLEIILIDPRNLEAYKSLVKIYLEKKKFSQAKRVSKIILKLNKQAIDWWKTFRRGEKIPQELINEFVSSLINLGIIYKELDKNIQAGEYFKKALEFNQNNPRLLDFLVENSIILNKKKEAEFYLKRLKEVNPENQKINEWEKMIKELK
ncbi:MAG: tetratricopeptide repeat protein [Patescibacteria group bacterium]